MRNQGSEEEGLARLLRDNAQPWMEEDDPALTSLFDRYADSKVVLLGEASHGTSEFYRARAAITRHLIRRHGYTMVAVEADWPDAAAIDRRARGMGPRPGAGPPFERFPAWMWRNTDVAAFVQWLAEHNAGLPGSRQVRFHGLDIYSLSQSMAAVLAYLARIDGEAARLARERYSCLSAWQQDPAAYGMAVLTRQHRDCEKAVVAQLRELLEKRLDYAAGDGDDFFDAAQNARLVASAERYYRAMFHGYAESWNLRDTHMFETLEHALHAGGANARAVVWAHNSHVGNAAATAMGRQRDEINLGQLCRQRYGDAAVLVGMGTDRGTVAAASDWGGPMEIKSVRPALAHSHEAAMRGAGIPRFALDLRTGTNALRQELDEWRLERFIGVIYRPETERHSHYALASLAQQFDAYLWLEKTTAVTPLDATSGSGPADTWPFGL